MESVSSEEIIRAIDHCSKKGFLELVKIIKHTTILEGHEEIVESWKRAMKRHREKDHGVTRSIMSKKPN